MTRRPLSPGMKAALVAMLAAAIAYLPVLRAEFVLDDHWMLREQIPSYESALSPFDARTSKWSWVYRPLGAMTNLFEEWVNQRLVDPGLPRGFDALDPARARIPHAFSLLFHLLATGAVTMFIAEMLGDRRAGGLGAAAGGLIFALQPIHVENVAWVAARADTLATLFLVVSLLLLFQARRRGAAALYAVAAGVYLLALLSKENAIVGVLLVPLALHVHPEPRVAGKPLLPPAALNGGVLTLYLALRWAGGGTGNLELPPDLSHMAAQGLAAAAFYLRKIFVPWPVTPLPVALPGPVATFSFLGGALAAAAGAVILCRRGERVFVFSLAWFVLGCLPVLPVAMLQYNLCSVAERFLYLPSVGFALAAGAAAAALAVSGKRGVAGGALCILLTGYGVAAWRAAATVWRNNFTLYTTMTRQRDSARHPASWVGLANAYRARQDLVEAERNFLRALGPDLTPSPVQAGAWNGLAELRQAEAKQLLALGRAAEAVALFREAEGFCTRAVEIDPFPGFRVNRAWIRLQLLVLDEEGGAPRAAAGLRGIGEDIAAVTRLDPKHPSLPVLQDLYRSLGGLEIP